MVLLIAVAFAAAIALAVVAISSAAAERAVSRRSLSAIDGYQLQSTVREQEMVAGVGARVIAPIGAAATQLVRRYTPVGYAENLARKTVLAGSPAGFEVDRLLVLKVLGLASGIAWVPLVFMVLHLHGLLSVLMLGVLWVGSFLAPDLALGNKIEARQHQIAVSLPDMLDLLVISVEAGSCRKPVWAPPERTRCARWTNAPRSTNCGRSSSRCSRPTRLVSRFLESCAHRPMRCVYAGACPLRKWPRRHP
jgi:tight adherence protein C